jgi:hypothetical protein
MEDHPQTVPVSRRTERRFNRKESFEDQYKGNLPFSVLKQSREGSQR